MIRNAENFILNNRIYLWLALATGFDLLIPLIGMQFSEDVNWGLLDFVTIGLLLFGISSLVVMTQRRITNKSSRIAIAVLGLFIVLFIWAELAVGIFTNWGS